MEYSLDQLASLVARHAPIFHIHPSDSFMPASVEFFMRHSQLVALESGGGSGTAGAGGTGATGGTQGTKRVLVPRGAVTGEGLVSLQEQHPPPTLLRMELDPAARVGFPKVSCG